MSEAAITCPDRSFFEEMRESLRHATEVERIVIPWVMPTLNKAQNWHPFARAKNVHMIHEAVRLSSEHMFDREPLPDTWEWLSLDKDGASSCPLVSGWVKSSWFIEAWHKSVLGRRSIEPHGTGTIIELFKLEDGRTHVHIHSLLTKLRDSDGTYTKHAIDGLVHAQFFKDDSPEYMTGPTKTQSLVPGKAMGLVKWKKLQGAK